jgi:uncharacterized protein
MSSSGASPATRPASDGARGIWRAQGSVLAVAGVLAGAILLWLAGDGWRMPVLFALGILFGLVLYLTAFGFTAAYRELLVQRETGAVRAQVLLLAVTTVLFAPVLASGTVLGREVIGAVAPVGVPVAAGAFVFGIGMQLAGGCGSGTLYTAGGGSPRMVAVLAAFCGGSFLASLHMPWWGRLPEWGEVSLGATLGWPAAVAAQLAVLAFAWAALGRIARSRQDDPGDAFRKAARQRTLVIGALLLSVLSLVMLVVAGHPWSITWAFTLWGAKAALLLGWDPATAAFWNGGFQSAALARGIFDDVTSVMDVGIVLGALAAAGAAGRFAPRLALTGRSLAAAVLGGLVMGYGARIAYGCNIGAFYSGVASTSLHGWLWIVTGMAGCWVGVRMRPWFGLENRSAPEAV